MLPLANPQVASTVLTSVIDKLVIYPDNMIANMNKFRGLVHSQRVLLALTQKGVSREDSYRLVQRNAMRVWEQGADFLTELKADPEVTAAMSIEEIEDKFDLGYHTKHVDTISPASSAPRPAPPAPIWTWGAHRVLDKV